jgi:NDP-hexose 4,6-dehydratase
MRLVCDSTRLRERTGWEPMLSRKDGLVLTIDWFSDPANLAKFKVGEYHQ